MRKPCRFEKYHKHPGQQDDMEAANRQDMDKSGPLEIAPQGFGNATAVPGEEPEQQSCFGWSQIIVKAGLNPHAKL